MNLIMNMINTSLLPAKPVLVRHSGYTDFYINHSDIYTILSISGLAPAIEHSSCDRTYNGVQTTERFNYEQKTTYRRPPTRRNSCGAA